MFIENWFAGQHKIMLTVRNNFDEGQKDVDYIDPKGDSNKTDYSL